MCFFGGCASITCEKCKPKLVHCPACGHIAFLSQKRCSFCHTLIPNEAKEKAKAAWRAKKESDSVR